MLCKLGRLSDLVRERALTMSVFENFTMSDSIANTARAACFFNGLQFSRATVSEGQWDDAC